MSILATIIARGIRITALALLLFAAGNVHADYIVKWSIEMDSAFAVSGQSEQPVITDFNNDSYPDIRVVDGQFGFTLLSGLDGELLWSSSGFDWFWAAHGNTDFDDGLEIVVVQLSQDSIPMSPFDVIRILDAATGEIEDEFDGLFGMPVLVDVDNDSSMEIIVVEGTNHVVCYEFDVGTGISDPDDGTDIPGEFSLEQNYPNPFNPNTTISYTVDHRTKIKISVYNIHGQVVRVLVNETQSRGTYSLTWDGTDAGGNLMASGVYFYKLRVGSQSAAKKMLLLK